MTAPLVTAVDPGPSFSGIVARSRETLLSWTVPTRLNTFESLADYAARVLSYTRAVSDLATKALHDSGHDVDRLLFAVEDFHVPNPHAGKVDPTQIAETAWLAGWLYAALREESFDGPHWAGHVVLVPPNKHGRSLLAAYPPELITEGEKRGNWRRRAAGRNTIESHARSAWDVGGAAMTQLRLDHAQEV